MQEKITENQLSMFEPTIYGYENSVKFHGEYIKTEKHQKHFRGQAKYMIEHYCNGEFWNAVEWVTKTGFAGANRILRYIANGKFYGYTRETKQISDLHFKYRIIRI